ncbi:U4/U6.U5 snRNP associated protein [Moesziomyces antarcticus T-34]|uniref:U4/U6.U5 snRNP associated protein n=1 Tax=Pseudozyma antarctica (strain T-34) TaxID=1151754 RepID=M9MIR3_PSEA3|nr:U4/U6.U5 snRNP associated protein [Moesziomyces antarcticus T-34]
MSEFQKEELSLEETNKLRISLGLKPLVADDAPSSSSEPAQKDAAPKLDPDAVAARNFQEKQQRDRRQREDAELRERLARAQAKRDAARRLNGPTLGDPEPTLGDASASSSRDTLRWIKESKKRAKEHAARRAKELQEQEARAEAEYRDADLVGLRVRHDADEFGEGEERILTLRDTDVLDDGDDELMDAALDQAERDQKNMERKKGVKEYSGLDDDETLLGRKKGVLSKYDADLPESELDTANDSGFRLGASVSAADRQARLRQEAEEAARRDNKQLLTLDYAKNQEVSDYLQEGDVGFKKPKAKKRKKAAKVKISFDDDDDDTPRGAASTSAAAEAGATPDVEMQESKPVARAARRQQTDNFVDDDELQASLAKSRRLKAKKTFKKMTPEMIAKSLAEQRAAEEAEQAAAGTSNGVASPMVANGAVKQEDGEGGLTFDETSEFVRAIRERPMESETRSSARTVKQESPVASLGEMQVKREESVDAGDVPMRELNASDIKAPVEADVAPDTVEIKEEPEEGEALAAVKPEPSDLDGDASEPLIGRGMASTLSFLRQQGMVPHVDAELATREQQQRQYDAWLASRRREEQLRETERLQSKASGSSVDQATREAQNRSREVEGARLAQERFRDYKPDVSIKYHDEFGRDLNQKEAWKHLSHVFHGKKPGTKKTEKRLKRIEEEQKRERMAAGDTPTGMMAAFQSRSERTGKAHMVLSVGSRDSAPQENDLLDGKPRDGLQLQKPKRAAPKSKKGEEIMSSVSVSELGSSAAASEAAGEGTVTTSTGGGWARIGSATPAAPSSASTATAAVGGGGFRPIASSTDSAPSTGNAPFRLAFGVKRKADDSH